MPKTTLTRLLLIAAACWLLWSLLIWQARPAPPAGVAQVVFLLSMVAALGACMWACLPLFPNLARGPRLAGAAVGVVAFLLILAVGHALGTAISQAAS